jgi:glycosyltransferase involved in cell wall biosynthesis
MFVCTTGGAGRRQLGGAERILVDLIPALGRTGVEVVACTLDDEVASSLRACGVPWINLGAQSRMDWRYARNIGRTVDSVRPDVVCSHLLSAAMHARAGLAFQRRRTPLVVTLHNSLWQYRAAATSWKQKASVQSNIGLDLLMRKVRPHASVAVSQFEADELRTRGHVKDVRVIPNPLPANWSAAARDRGSQHSSTMRVGYLGRLEKEKGADLIAGIAARLPHAQFVVAGTGSVPIQRAPNIQPVGFVDAAGFLREIDCLIVPSRVEAFGLSALEAMSVGVPVVHSAAGGLAEITAHAEGVLAFRADLDPVSIASAVQRAMAGVGDHARGAVAAWYMQEYAFAKCVERWHTLYRSVAHADE